ncbi:MAG: polymer-forming cytoskeletal protein [Chloroflexi bacterium]|nr:polymer-forming cytoskeletal protein [Chloroflexota bacterium]
MASTIHSTQPTMTAPTAERPTSESLVDRDSHFDGLYRTKHNLRVEGIAEGEIECEGTLTVEKGARVRAKVTARNVTVAGELEGEVTCQDTFQIMPSGQVEATVVARRLIVQEGGFYNGEFRMITEEPESNRTSRTSAELRAEEWLSRLTSPASPPQDEEGEEEEE